MKSTPHRLLYFTNNDSGRDVEMMLPVIYFAERFLNCTVSTTLTTNIYEIHKQRPDCVLLANTIGAKLHFHIAREAHRAGIPVFSLVSEGNFKTDGSFDHWGYNTAKELYEDYICCWSERTRDYLCRLLPDNTDRIKVTGGVGFDRYRILDFEERSSFRRRHRLDAEKFSTIIGYAGWGFAKLAHPRGRSELLAYFNKDTDRLEWAEEQRKALLEILKQAIQAQPETLFVLKKHPTETVAAEPGSDHNEMAALQDFPNVLYLKEDSIHDLMHVADLWWVYESTTALEAHLMGTQTLFIVPDPDFPRTNLHAGFAEARTFEEVRAMTEQFFTTGSLPEYNSPEKIKRREEIIKDSFGYDDGYNHIRAAHYLRKTLNAPSSYSKKGFSLYYMLVYWVLKFLTPFYRAQVFSKLPWINRKLWVFDRYHLKNLPQLHRRYARCLERFYTQERIPEKMKAGTLFRDILDPTETSS